MFDQTFIQTVIAEQQRRFDHEAARKRLLADAAAQRGRGRRRGTRRAAASIGALFVAGWLLLLLL